MRMDSVFTPTKFRRDYTNSPTKAFDAVEDIKDWFKHSGREWDVLSPNMAKVVDVEQFVNWAGFAGIEGYPVEAWYDLYHGQGAYRKAMDIVDTKLLKDLGVVLAETEKTA